MKKILLYIISMFVWLIGGNAQPPQQPLNQIAFSLLEQQPVNYPYTFVVLGDTREHYDVENDVEGDYSTMMSQTFLNILEELKHLQPQPAFIINLGDAVLGEVYNNNTGGNNSNTYYQQYPAYYYYISHFMEETHIPFFTIPGNHEFWGTNYNTLFLEYIGEYRNYFEYGNTGIIWVNNGRNPFNWTWTDYWFSDNDINFAESKLNNANRPPVIFTLMHVPFYVATTDTYGIRIFPYKVNSFNNYYHMISTKNITANFSAHQHNYQRYIYCNDDLIDIVSGGGGAEIHELSYSPPVSIAHNHFLVITVTENNYAKVEMHLYPEGHNEMAKKFDFIIPADSSAWIHNVTVHSGHIHYYSVRKSLFAGGNGTTFTTDNGSTTEMTAGKIIRLNPGTTIKKGSRFKAYISNFECSPTPDFSPVNTESSQKKHKK